MPTNLIVDSDTYPTTQIFNYFLQRKASDKHGRLKQLGWLGEVLLEVVSKSWQDYGSRIRIEDHDLRRLSPNYLQRISERRNRTFADIDPNDLEQSFALVPQSPITSRMVKRMLTDLYRLTGIPEPIEQPYVQPSFLSLALRIDENIPIGSKVRPTEGTEIDIYAVPDLGAHVIEKLSASDLICLGATIIIEGRQRVETQVRDDLKGYALAASLRSRCRF